MNKFNKKFNEIMNSRIFYESTKTLSHNYSIIQNNLTKTAKDFYDSIIVINDNNIITEDRKDIQYNSALINKIFQCNSFTQLSANDIYSRCSNSIKENYTIKKDIPAYIFKFSFSNNAKFICNIFSSFNIEFSLKTGTLKEKYQFEENIFKSNYSNSNGLCSYQKDYVLLLFNIDNYTETTIKHELFHYLQWILKKEKTKIKEKFNDIPELQLTINDLKYLFDSYEFETHIKVDLINQLEEIYYKFYKHLSKEEFINRFIKVVENDPLNIVDKFFDMFLKIKNKDTTMFRLFAACFIVKDKLYLLNAIKWLKETFK